ncbi:hypothetical protein L249_6574 [Ophiocordyceps polyrhachis-furcata BCC 54312]|uniref:Uncharacterized protein n=1 Tax=Ophiocordyceps polyrhachis-furcata BCC 54312 TaxID=1330021 RepID=A0A367LKC3_9HYPO|nr:hypothetical protein L249_6574 [Ophiocordyceps polyrhachis-furcata BCC 54312]
MHVGGCFCETVMYFFGPICYTFFFLLLETRWPRSSYIPLSIHEPHGDLSIRGQMSAWNNTDKRQQRPLSIHITFDASSSPMDSISSDIQSNAALLDHRNVHTHPTFMTTEISRAVSVFPAPVLQTNIKAHHTLAHTYKSNGITRRHRRTSLWVSAYDKNRSG